MKNCSQCNSFDPYYKGGWCDWHKCTTSPNSSCNVADDNGGGFKKFQCCTCYWYDSNYHGGWCDKYKTDVYASSSCNSWTD